MPKLEDWEIKKYWQIFQGLKPVNNKLSGESVSPVLKNSRLKDEQLSQIWNLSDIDGDGNLDFEEFCITMRLIFDLVNGNLQSVPNELPDWLIPASKAHLIQANKAVANGSNTYQLGNDRSSNDDDDEDTLSDDFDWYMSPTDKATYESIYNSNSDSYGRVRFNSLDDLYKTLTKVPRSDISSAWNLVNPKSSETIDKDQVMVFMHILNQRENGKRVPRYVPASLRATFSKETPSYDLNSTSKPQLDTQLSGKKGFAESYLSKVGQSSSKIYKEEGTDFSATEGTDWEMVRLRRELKDLNNLLERTSDETKNDAEDELLVTKHEFEQLLKYKTEKLRKFDKLTNSNKDLKGITNDIELIENQVKTLYEFLHEREAELKRINESINALTS